MAIAAAGTPRAIHKIRYITQEAFLPPSDAARVCPGARRPAPNHAPAVWGLLDPTFGRYSMCGIRFWKKLRNADLPIQIVAERPGDPIIE